MFTHTLAIQYIGGATNPVIVNASVAATAQNGIDLQLLYPGTTDTPVDIPTKITEIKLGIIYTDQPVRICVNAVHTGTPVATINMVGGVPLLFGTFLVQASPYVADIVTLYLTNQSTTSSAANVSIRHLLASSGGA
jgi:hypothetical protein